MKEITWDQGGEIRITEQKSLTLSGKRLLFSGVIMQKSCGKRHEISRAQRRLKRHMEIRIYTGVAVVQDLRDHKMSGLA